MDPARFDSALRALSTLGDRLPSRRALLGALVGSPLVIASAGGFATEAKRHKKHKKRRRGRGHDRPQCLADGEPLDDGCSAETASLCCSGVCSDETGNCGECLLAGEPISGACTSESSRICCSGVCVQDAGGAACS
jgi:hypothetical protein